MKNVTVCTYDGTKRDEQRRDKTRKDVKKRDKTRKEENR
jgi:hypothetical protein